MCERGKGRGNRTLSLIFSLPGCLTCHSTCTRGSLSSASLEVIFIQGGLSLSSSVNCSPSSSSPAVLSTNCISSGSVMVLLRAIQHVLQYAADYIVTTRSRPSYASCSSPPAQYYTHLMRYKGQRNNYVTRSISRTASAT